MSVNILSHYIAGEWVTANEGEWTADVNPSDATQVLAAGEFFTETKRVQINPVAGR